MTQADFLYTAGSAVIFLGGLALAAQRLGLFLGTQNKARIDAMEKQGEKMAVMLARIEQKQAEQDRVLARIETRLCELDRRLGKLEDRFYNRVVQ